MWKPRWILALPLALAATLSPGISRAAGVRDLAGLFSTDAVRRAQAELDRVERENRLPTIIETVPSLNGQDVREVLERHAEQASAHGLYVLISKEPHKIDVRASRNNSRAMTPGRVRAIREAFLQEFKKEDYNAGLLRGVEEIRNEASAAQAELRAAGVPPARRVIPGRVPARGGGFGLGSLLGIGLLVLAVLFVVRLLGALFGGGARGYAGPPGAMGRPGYGPGYGGYGGGGGGFMSSLFGGLGGALAGNWLYDQMSGRHHGGGYVDNASYNTGADPGAGAGADDWSGGSDAAGDWGGGGGDAGGGDWGGGGGDWGGGGDGGAGGDW
jgi:uncharacterized protein